MSHFISSFVLRLYRVTDNSDGKSVEVPCGAEQEKARYSWMSGYFGPRDGWMPWTALSFRFLSCLQVNKHLNVIPEQLRSTNTSRSCL